jgi:hypothetical protein
VNERTARCGSGKQRPIAHAVSGCRASGLLAGARR